jgi:hypothetical protein
MTNLSTGTGIVLEPVLIFEPSEPVSFDEAIKMLQSSDQSQVSITSNQRLIEEMQKQAGGSNA